MTPATSLSSPVSGLPAQATPAAPVRLWDSPLAWARAATSTTPGWLRGWQVFGVVLALVFGLSVWRYDVYISNAVQTVTHDTVPSVVAAEQLRVQMAEAHASMTNIFLTGEKGTTGKNGKAYLAAMRQAQQSTLDAAQNITYGDAERKPLYAVMTGLTDYERLVGAALARGQVGPELLQADKLMRETIAPAAVALDATNFNALQAAYGVFNASHTMHALGMALLAVGLAVYLGFAQFRLYLHFRRRLNAGLLAASVLYAVGAVVLLVSVTSLRHNLTTAKESAFDSVHALWKARANAYEANAYESLYLLTAGQPDLQKTYAEGYRDKAHRIANLDAGSGKMGGYLGDELANITFEGEEALAQAASRTWQAYDTVDTKIRTLESSGHHADAVALCLGEKAGESNWAFDRFNEALTRVLDLNQHEFDQHAASANATARRLGVIEYLLTALLALGVFLGFKPRLDEYHR